MFVIFISTIKFTIVPRNLVSALYADIEILAPRGKIPYKMHVRLNLFD